MISNKYDKYIHGLIPGFLIHLGLGNMFFWSQITNKIALSTNVDETKTHWIFAVLLFFLGISASLSGRLSERGVKLASLTSLFTFTIGMLVSIIGVYMKSFEMLVIGFGVISAIGIGIGYLVPIKNSMLWFPNNIGLSVGGVILGFSISSVLSNIVVYLNYDNELPILIFKMLVLSFVPMLVGSLMIKRPRWYKSTKWYSVKKVVCDSLSIIRSDIFTILWLIIFFKLTAGLMIIYNQIEMLNYDISRFSYNEIILTVVLAGLSNGVGRISAAFMIDRTPVGKRINLNYLIFGIPTISLVIMYLIHSWSVLPILLCIISFSYGFGVCSIPMLLNESFNASEYTGTIQGVMFTSVCMSGLVGSSVGYIIIKFMGLNLMLSIPAIMYLVGLILSVILINKIKREGRYELS